MKSTKKAAPPRAINEIAADIEKAVVESNDARRGLILAEQRDAKARLTFRRLKRELNLAAVGKGVRR